MPEVGDETEGEEEDQLEKQPKENPFHCSECECEKGFANAHIVQSVLHVSKWKEIKVPVKIWIWSKFLIKLLM